MEDFLPTELDAETKAFFLILPQSKVVLLQAFMELYEGVGIVRTLSLKDGLVTVLTTTSLAESCREILIDLQEKLEWKPSPVPSKDLMERYLGYFSHASNNS